jgi:predicted ABC-type ATPase
VPEERIRARHRRLWALMDEAVRLAHDTRVLDNSSAQKPFRLVARYEQGRPLGPVSYPAWSPWWGPAERH